MWADIQTTIAELWAEDRIRAAVIAISSIGVAYLGEFLFRRTLMVMAAKTKTDLDDKIVAALRRPILLTVILSGLAWALSIVLDRGTFLVYGVIKTLIVVTWTSAGFRTAEAILQTMSTRAKQDGLVQARTMPAFDMLAKSLIIGAAAYFLFLSWEIDVSAWLASAGILGIAVGFAARDSLANLFAGIFLLADNIYKVGDFVVLDNRPDLRGRVTRIGMRSTRILTLDDVEINVPNSLIGNATVVNEVGGPSIRQRIKVTTSVAYGSDLDQVFEVLSACADGVDGVCNHPTPIVRFTNFGDSGLDFDLLVWITNPADRDNIQSVLNTRIYKALNEADIEIPYPKQDLYIKETPGMGGGPANENG